LQKQAGKAEKKLPPPTDANSTRRLVAKAARKFHRSEDPNSTVKLAAKADQSEPNNTKDQLKRRAKQASKKLATAVDNESDDLFKQERNTRENKRAFWLRRFYRSAYFSHTPEGLFYFLLEVKFFGRKKG
jgi:hypothetical protein